MLSFVGKHLSFYPKDVCPFSVFFEEELSLQVCLIKYIEKYVENEISNSTFDTKKRKKQKREIEEQKHNPTSKTSIPKLLKNCIQSFIYSLLYTNCISNLL